MKLIKKEKFITIAAACIMATSALITTVSAANYGHDGDKWYAGCDVGMIPVYNYNLVRQYSEFYCPEETHTATVLMKKKGGNEKYFKAKATKKNWAKTDSNWYAQDSNLEIRRSYYDHRDYL